jgi:hypothetical protein
MFMGFSQTRGLKMKETHFPSTKEENDKLVGELDKESLLLFNIIRREALKSDPDDSLVQMKHIYEQMPNVSRSSIIGRYGALARKGLVYTRQEELEDERVEKFIYLPEYENGWWPPPLKKTSETLSDERVDSLMDLHSHENPILRRFDIDPEEKPSKVQEVKRDTPSPEFKTVPNRFEILLGFLDKDYIIFSFENGQCTKVGGFDTIEKVRGYLNQCPEQVHKVFQGLQVRKKISFELEARSKK